MKHITNEMKLSPSIVTVSAKDVRAMALTQKPRQFLRLRLRIEGATYFVVKCTDMGQ